MTKGMGTMMGPHTRNEMTVSVISAGSVSNTRLMIARFRMRMSGSACSNACSNGSDGCSKGSDAVSAVEDRAECGAAASAGSGDAE